MPVTCEPVKKFPWYRCGRGLRHPFCTNAPTVANANALRPGNAASHAVPVQQTPRESFARASCISSALDFSEIEARREQRRQAPLAITRLERDQRPMNRGISGWRDTDQPKTFVCANYDFTNAVGIRDERDAGGRLHGSTSHSPPEASIPQTACGQVCFRAPSACSR
jgi:hypothetical protein